MIDESAAGAGMGSAPQDGDVAAPGTHEQPEARTSTEEPLRQEVAPGAPEEAAVHAVAPAASAALSAQAEAGQTEAQAVAGTEEQASRQTEGQQNGQTEGQPNGQIELPVDPAAYGPDPRTFEEMGLHPDVLRALTELGFSLPMPVQRSAYRPVMAGRDLIVQSRTGSGKTAAFGIPFAQGLIDAEQDNRGGKVQGLVLGPTRELALQVATEVGRIAAYRGIHVVPVYGGAPMGRQVEALQAGGQVVSGTPGRVLDHLRRGTLQLQGIRVLVLDEADEMLSMGFYEEIIEIIKRCPKDRQTLLFSATMPEDVERISLRHMRSPLKLQLSADFVGVAEIKHAYYMVSGMGRPRDLLRVLEVERPESAIVFCNTREETSLVAEYLRGQGLDAEAISSDLTQADRERVMGRTKAKNLKYLVATDIAARGIDISDLSHVINFTFPESAEVYIHRTGRTGRAGKSGVAISLIGPRELGNFYYLKLTYKIRPEERSLPSEEELQTLREGQYIDRLQQELQRDPGAQWRSLLRRVLATDDGERVLALLLERHLLAPARPHEHAAGAEAPRREHRPEHRTEHRPEHRPEQRADHRGEHRAGLRERPGRDGDRDRRRPAGRREEEFAESPSRLRERQERDERRRRDEPRGAERSGSGDRSERPERHGTRGRPAPNGRSDRPARDLRPEEPAAPAVAEPVTPPAAQAQPAPAEPVREAPAEAVQQPEAVAPVQEAAAAEQAVQQAGQQPTPPIEDSGEVVGDEGEEEEAQAEAADGSTSEETARKRRRRGGRGRRRGERPNAASGETPAGEEAGAPAAEPKRPLTPRPEDVIQVEDGREFWEAWVDSRSSAASPAQKQDEEEEGAEASSDAGGDAGAEGERGRRRRRRRPTPERNGDSKLVVGPGELRVYLNLGRRDGLDEGVLVSLLSQRGLPTFASEVRGTHTYLAVPEALVEGVVSALNGQTHGSREMHCELARR